MADMRDHCLYEIDWECDVRDYIDDFKTGERHYLDTFTIKTGIYRVIANRWQHGEDIAKVMVNAHLSYGSNITLTGIRKSRIDAFVEVHSFE